MPHAMGSFSVIEIVGGICFAAVLVFAVAYLPKLALLAGSLSQSEDELAHTIERGLEPILGVNPSEPTPGQNRVDIAPVVQVEGCTIVVKDKHVPSCETPYETRALSTTTVIDLSEVSEVEEVLVRPRLQKVLKFRRDRASQHVAAEAKRAYMAQVSQLPSPYHGPHGIAPAGTFPADPPTAAFLAVLDREGVNTRETTRRCPNGTSSHGLILWVHLYVQSAVSEPVMKALRQLRVRCATWGAVAPDADPHPRGLTLSVRGYVA